MDCIAAPRTIMNCGDMRTGMGMDTKSLWLCWAWKFVNIFATCIVVWGFVCRHNDLLWFCLRLTLVFTSNCTGVSRQKYCEKLIPFIPYSSQGGSMAVLLQFQWRQYQRPSLKPNYLSSHSVTSALFHSQVTATVSHPLESEVVDSMWCELAKSP